MTPSARGGLMIAAALTASCATIIDADFDGLMPRPIEESGGAVDSGAAGGDGTVEAGGGAGGTEADEAASDRSTPSEASPLDASMDGAAGAAPLIDAMSEHDNSFTTEDAADAAAAEAGPIEGSADGGTDAAESGSTGRVVINEVQGTGPDFVELYNPTGDPVVLDGHAVAQAIGSDGGPDLGAPLKFPTGTTLAGGEYLLVIANQVSTGGPYSACAGLAPLCYWVEWGISRDGEGIYLLAPNRSIIDQVYYPGSVGNHTYGREPNGTGPFTSTASTPYGPNTL